MPLPKPKPTEERQAYLSRCMADRTMRQEFRTRDQRFAVCQVQWENKK